MEIILFYKQSCSTLFFLIMITASVPLFAASNRQQFKDVEEEFAGIQKKIFKNDQKKAADKIDKIVEILEKFRKKSGGRNHKSFRNLIKESNRFKRRLQNGTIQPERKLQELSFNVNQAVAMFLCRNNELIKSGQMKDEIVSCVPQQCLYKQGIYHVIFDPANQEEIKDCRQTLTEQDVFDLTGTGD